MKVIEAYWESEEFDIKNHWQTVKHLVFLKVEENATDEEIEDLLKRKDVKKIIKK